MTETTPEAAETVAELNGLAHTHEQAEKNDPIKGRGKRHRRLHLALRKAAALLEATAVERDTALAEVQRLRTAQGAAGVLLSEIPRCSDAAFDAGAQWGLSHFQVGSIVGAFLRALTQETPDGQ